MLDIYTAAVETGIFLLIAVWFVLERPWEGK